MKSDSEESLSDIEIVPIDSGDPNWRRKLTKTENLLREAEAKLTELKAVCAKSREEKERVYQDALALRQQRDNLELQARIAQKEIEKWQNDVLCTNCCCCRNPLDETASLINGDVNQVPSTCICRSKRFVKGVITGAIIFALLLVGLFLFLYFYHPSLNKDHFCHVQANCSKRVSFSVGDEDYSDLKAEMFRVNGYSRLNIINGSFVLASLVMRPDKGTFFSMSDSNQGDIGCSPYEGVVVSLDDYKYNGFGPAGEYMFTAVLPNGRGTLSICVSMGSGVITREILDIDVVMHGSARTVSAEVIYDSVNKDYKLETSDDTFVIKSSECPSAATRPAEAITTKCDDAK